MNQGFLLAALLYYVTSGVTSQGEDYVIDYAGTDYEEPQGHEWVEREGTSLEYHFHAEKKNFDKANSFCLDEDADLVSIATEVENAWVHSNRDQSESQWIGLRKAGKSWIWIDYVTESEYRNFGPNEPKAQKDLCAAYAKRTGESRWFTHDCDIPREFICKRKKSPCVPNPCSDEEECRVDGDDYECICHHCKSDFELSVAKWAGNTFLLVIGIFIIVVIVVILLVILGTCVRGCVESRRAPNLLPVKYSKRDSPSKDNNSSNSNLYNSTPRPKKKKVPTATLR